MKGTHAKDHQDLHLTDLLLALTVLGLAFTGTLWVVPFVGGFNEAEGYQREYNTHALHAGIPPIPIAVRQIWKPKLGVADRCISCHVAMDGAAAIPGQHRPLMSEHPPLPHSPREFGCTICHGGQGRATRESPAHGERDLWGDPILERPYYEAGCGTCHTHIPVPPAALVKRGAQLVKEQECQACHQGDRSLDTVGLRGFTPDWHTRHMGLVQGDIGFAPLMDEDLPAVDAYLATQVGMPKVMAGKMLVHQWGCRGCHRVGGVGGEEGPDLSSVGLKRLANADFAGVEGAHTLPTWHREHLLNPGKVVPQSKMPALGLSPLQAEQVTAYLMSLRARPLPEDLVPKDRVRALRLGQRDFATDGESLFQTFCVACHGVRGEGRNFPPQKQQFPGIGRADFLAVADDVFLRRNILEGRPGRQMMAWGAKEGGLQTSEVDSLVAYLRSLQPKAPPFAEVMASPAEPEPGERYFGQVCAACHGDQGQGSRIGPPLAAMDNLVTSNPNAIYGTLANGVAGTAMGSFATWDATTLRSLVIKVRDLPRTPAKRDGWKPQAGDAIRGAQVFERTCATCHGKQAEGGEGPALNNPVLLATASDGFLAATIVRGRTRPERSMPAFGTGTAEFPRLSPDDVADVVAHLRSLAPGASVQPPTAARE